MNLAHNLEQAARFFPDRPVLWEENQRLTYAALDEMAGRAAAGLKTLGLGPGDRVALCAPNSGQWLALYFGALKLGAAAVCLSAQLSPQELELLVSHCRPQAILATPERLEQLRALRPSAGLKTIICPGGDLDFPRLLELGQAPLAAVERQREDLAAVLYTGGTTGLPKGVMLTHENIQSAVQTVARMERSTENDVALCFLPFNHVFGQVHIMNATIFSAGGLVLMPGFDLEQALEAIAQQGVTKLYAVPTIYVRLLQVPELKRRLGQVRYCFSAAASMARELVERWHQTTGLTIHEAYGMTETASMVTYNHYYRHKPGSVGSAAGGAEVAILDPQGRPVPAGEEGEICIRGRNVMAGYLDNPQATRDAFFGPWLRSGDIGYVDDEGYLFIVDRLKDLIITGGENVYPREVEEVLHSHPAVAECAVIGRPDPEYGERVTAYLVPKSEPGPSPEELKAFCKARLSPYKVPKEFVLMDRLPTSPAGKILKRELRRMVTG